LVIRFDIGLNICYLLFITVKRLISQILAGILGLYLAIRFIPDVEFIDPWRWEILIFAGIVLGLINFFIKPVLKIITLPLRIFTFGLFSLIINMGMVWIVARIFSQLKISTILSLFLTSVIVWGLNLIFPLFIPSKTRSESSTFFK